jgi:hypothetical protein
MGRDKITGCLLPWTPRQPTIYCSVPRLNVTSIPRLSLYSRRNRSLNSSHCVERVKLIYITVIFCLWQFMKRQVLSALNLGRHWTVVALLQAQRLSRAPVNSHAEREGLLLQVQDAAEALYLGRRSRPIRWGHGQRRRRACRSEATNAPEPVRGHFPSEPPAGDSSPRPRYVDPALSLCCRAAS